MLSFTSLLLPALLGGVAVFITSFVLRMVLKYHWKDFDKLPNEGAVMDALREQGAAQGQYMFPHCANMAEMENTDWLARYEQGPKGSIFLLADGSWKIGKALGQSFLFNFGVALFAAWGVTHFLAPDASASRVWCFVSTFGFLAFGGSSIWGPIWKGSHWRVCLLELMDGALYGVAMGLPFYLLA